MSKTISLIMISALVLGAFSFGIFQNQKAKVTFEANERLESEKFDLKIDLDSANDKIHDLAEENEDLQAQIVVLKDSIAMYETEISKLKKSLYRRKKEIAKVEQDMTTMRAKYIALERQIITLRESGTAKDAIIAELEQRKVAIQQENDRIYEENVVVKQDLEASEADVVDLEMQKVKQEELLEILEYTSIAFDKISIKKTETGQDGNKIKKDGKAWNYTFVDVRFEHENIQHLIDEFFVLKVVDVETNAELSYVESNPAFPDSDSDHKGIEFQFLGEPIQLTFHNNEIKTGKNYAVQLYYVRDGKEHRLKNGYRQFIVDGKVVKSL